MTGLKVGVRIVAGRLLLASSVGLLLAAAIGFTAALPAHAASKAARDRTAQERGAALFHDKGCEHCHGVDGAGTERAPALSGVGRSMRKLEIERQIRAGGKEMPAFGDALTNDELQDLVAYLAAKKKNVAKPAAGPGVSGSSQTNLEEFYGSVTG